MGYDFPPPTAFGEVYEGYTWDGEKWVAGEAAFSGATPDWVPPGALIHIEFYDGVARGWDGANVLDAAGIGQLLGNDPNGDWWSGGSQYSATGVTANGYDYYAYDDSGYGPAAIGALKALIPTPITIVMTTNFDEWYAEMYMAFTPEGADNAVEIWSTVGGNILTWSNTGQSISLPGALNTTPGVFKQNRIAFTLRQVIDQLPGYLAISANGADEQQVSLTGADFLTGVSESWYLDHIPLQAITVYPEQPIESLKVLSNLHLDPEVKAITPRDLPVGAEAFELSVQGFWFDPEAVIQVDGVDQVTTNVSISLLTATVARSATPHIAKITVKSGTDRISNDNHVLEFYDPATGPTWAAGATIFIDLIKPGRVWTGTEVLSADKATGIGLYLGFDANTNAVLGGANSLYEERCVQHEGYNSSWLNNSGRERPPAYLAALRDTLLSASGATMQITTRTTNGWWVKRAHLRMVSTNGTNGIDILNYGDGYRIGTSGGGPLEWEPVGCFVEPVGESYEEYIRNRFAFTLTSTRFEFAANGVASSEGAFTLTDADRPAANPLTGIVEIGYNIESIALYSTLPTIDGLLELSALEALPPPEIEPVMISATPDTIASSGPPFTITVTGTGFAEGLIIEFQNVSYPATLVDETTITASGVPSPTTTAGSSYSVKVRNSSDNIYIDGSGSDSIIVTAALVIPDWVPPNAIAFIDFVGSTPQGRGWDGYGVYDAVTLSEMLGADPDVDGYSWGSLYDPEAIGPNGYDYYLTAQLYGPAAVNRFKAIVVEGATYVFRFHLTSNDFFWIPFIASDQAAVEMWLERPVGVGGSLIVTTVQGEIMDFGHCLFNDAENRIAFTLTPTRVEVSVNGLPYAASTLSEFDFPDGPTKGLYIDGSDIMDIVAYPPVAATELDALSAIVPPVPPVYTDLPAAAFTINFLNNTATASGVTVGIETLVGTDTTAAEPTGYNPTTGLSAAGYSVMASGVGSLAFIGPVKAAMLNGATVVVTYLNEATGNPTLSFFGVTPQSHLVSMGLMGNGQMTMYASSHNIFSQESVEGYFDNTAGAINRIATKAIHVNNNSGLLVSVNGKSQLGSPVIPDLAWSMGYITLDCADSRIQTVEVYSNGLVPIDMLPSLSANPYVPPVPGTVPAWVPEGAIVAVDFVIPGRSWNGTTEGDGNTGIGGLIGSDPDATAYAGVTGYGASGLSLTGYDYAQVTGDPSPAYIGALKSAVLSEATVVATVIGKSGMGRHSPSFSIMSADAVDGVEIMPNGADFTITSKGGPLSLNLLGVFVPPEGSLPVRNRFAFTITATRIEVAVNGRGEIAGTLVDTDRPAANPFACFVEWGQDIESIVVYPPLPTIDGLLELSSTGTPPPPVPVIDTLTPASAVAGSLLFTLTVTGSNFDATSVVMVDTNNHGATFISSTQITCNITPPAVEGSMVVYVRNGSGTASNSMTLTITAAAPPPEMVIPAGALAHIEFTNGGRAWDGTNMLDAVGIGTLLGSDPVQDAWSGSTTGYDPAHITENGYLPPIGFNMAFLAPLKAIMFPASTVVLRWKPSIGIGSQSELVFYNEGGAQAMRLYHSGPSWDAYFFKSTSMLYVEDGTINRTNMSPNAGGVTINGQVISLSANQSVQLDTTLVEADLPAASPFNCGAISGNIIVSFTVYPVQADLAPLTAPELSTAVRSANKKKRKVIESALQARHNAKVKPRKRKVEAPVRQSPRADHDRLTEAQQRMLGIAPHTKKKGKR
jgi:IPT/TIG domain